MARLAKQATLVATQFRGRMDLPKEKFHLESGLNQRGEARKGVPTTKAPAFPRSKTPTGGVQPGTSGSAGKALFCFGSALLGNFAHLLTAHGAAGEVKHPTSPRRRDDGTHVSYFAPSVATPPNRPSGAPGATGRGARATEPRGPALRARLHPGASIEEPRLHRLPPPPAPRLEARPEPHYTLTETSQDDLTR